MIIWVKWVKVPGRVIGEINNIAWYLILVLLHHLRCRSYFKCILRLQQHGRSARLSCLTGIWACFCPGFCLTGFCLSYFISRDSRSLSSMRGDCRRNSVIFLFLNDLISALVYVCIFIPRTMTQESIRDKAVTQKALCGANAKHRCKYQARSQRALRVNAF